MTIGLKAENGMVHIEMTEDDSDKTYILKLNANEAREVVLGLMNCLSKIENSSNDE